MTKRISRPHGQKDFMYRQRHLESEGRDNYDNIFGKKDFISKKIAVPESFKGNSDKPTKP